MKKFLPKPSGFTLIELMVVITIIAILALIGLVAYSNIQQHVRDTKRKADMNAIAKALESNYTPNSATPYQPVDDTMFVGGVIPTNPSTGGAAYAYPSASASAFTVCAKLEKQTGNADLNTSSVCDGGGYNTNRTNGACYCVKNQR